MRPMMEQETQTTWQGIIDSRPTVMYEDPEHITLRMRSAEGKFLEVFVPMTLMRQMPELFNRGRAIAITGETMAQASRLKCRFWCCRHRKSRIGDSHCEGQRLVFRLVLFTYHIS